MIINKTKVLLPQTRVTFALLFLFRLFDLLAPKDFKIIWLSNLLIMSVPDKGYSREVSCILNVISTFFTKYILFIVITFVLLINNNGNSVFIFL